MTKIDQSLIDAWHDQIKGLSQEELAEMAQKAEDLSEYAEARGPTTPEELDQWFKERVGVDVPKVAVCPGHTAPFDIACEIAFFKVLRLLIIASRGGAKTSLMAWLDDLAAEFHPGWEGFTTGPGIRQGERKYEHLLPFVVEGGVIGGKELPHIAQSTQTQTVWKNGSKVSIAPGCLPYGAKILTDQGELEIGRIVSERLPVKVKSYDFESEEWVWSQVIDWHDNGVGGDDWVKMKYDLGASGPSHLTATAGHRIMRPDGSKTSLSHLSVGDEVCVPGLRFSEQQEQVLMGLMLGDGAIHNTGSLRIEHGLGQSYYLDWFDDAFSELSPNRGPRKSKDGKHNTQVSYYKACHRTREARREWYSSGTKRVPDVIWDQLGPLGLAVWLMDDGCFWRKNKESGCWRIDAHNFNKRERNAALAYFDQLGLGCKWMPVNRDADQYMLVFDSISSLSLSCLVADYLDTSERQDKGWKKWKAQPIEEHAREDLLVAKVELVEPVKTPRRSGGAISHRYDLTVEKTANYCVRSGLLISNTVGAVNGPRAPRLHRDEVELMQEDVYKQAGNIPAGRTCKDGRYTPAQFIDTSTMKWAHGRVAAMKEEYEDAVRAGRRPIREVRVFCVFEVAQERPDCQKADPKDRAARLKELGRDPCEMCDCDTYFSDVWDPEEEGQDPKPRSLADVCAGRFFRSRGFKPPDDIQSLFLENPRAEWEAEQECSAPSKEGVYIRSYSENLHGLAAYEPDPENGPIYMGVDWGGEDAHSVGWYQLLDREVEAPAYVNQGMKKLPKGSLVRFAEIYISGVGNVAVGEKVIEREDKWRAQYPGWRVKERYPDSANLSGRFDWRDHLGLETTSRIKKDFDEELKYLRSRVGNRKFFLVIPACPQFNKAIKAWREENGHEVHDWASHPMAEFRYVEHNIQVIGRKAAPGRGEQPIPRADTDDDIVEERERSHSVRRTRQLQREVVGAGGAEDSPVRTSRGSMGGSRTGGIEYGNRF